mgnify:CR=1 FL=1
MDLKTSLVNEDSGLVHFHMLYPKCANSLEVDSFQPLEGNNGEQGESQLSPVFREAACDCIWLVHRQR